MNVHRGGAESTLTNSFLVLQKFIPGLDLHLRLSGNNRTDTVSTTASRKVFICMQFRCATGKEKHLFLLPLAALLTQLCMYSAYILSEHISACTPWLKVASKNASTLLITTSLAGGDCGGAVDALSAVDMSHTCIFFEHLSKISGYTDGNNQSSRFLGT
jgi:hypothetical protein